jgi:hypothetical protein
MKTMKPFMMIALFFMGLSLTAQVNFSGTWAFNESKSKFGEGGPGGPGGPGMGGTAIVVKQDANNLSVERTMRGRDGEEMKMTEKYTLDGKVCENTMMMDMVRKSTVTWSADKKSITIASSMTFDRGGESREMKQSETWRLGDDGKTLMIESTRPTREGDSMNITMVYDKK